MEFRLPDVSIHPQIYSSFVVNDEDFYVAVLTEEYTEQAVELLRKFVIPEENFCKAIQIHTKPNAMKIMSDRYRNLIENKMSLACFHRASNELVGVNILALTTKGETHNSNDDPDLKILRESRDFTSSLYDIFEHYPVDQYLDAFGLGVISEYRRKGIAVELLKARIPLMKALGLSLTATAFSTISSQKAASKAGFIEVFAISYEELQMKFPHYDFSEATGTHSKTFVLQIFP